MNAPIRGENTKPELWRDGSLRHFGINPYGDNLFRVVWGPSRKHLVGGNWEDHDIIIPTDAELANHGHDISLVRRVIEYRWISKYIQEQWVLERWLTPIQYAGTPATWFATQYDQEAKLLTLGPYPAHGEYEECYSFPERPTSSMIESVIQMLVYGAQYSDAERKEALMAVEEGKKWDWKNHCEAIIRDSQGAFNNAPSSVNPAKRTADKVRLDRTAEELGLPSGEGKFFIGGKNATDSRTSS
jgi:hypothetical protein